MLAALLASCGLVGAATAGEHEVAAAVAPASPPAAALGPAAPAAMLGPPAVPAASPAAVLGPTAAPCPEATPAAPATHGLFRPIAAAVIAAGCLGGAAKNAFTDHPTGGFHVTREEWFGEHAYVGGADKVSHFVSFEIIARELAGLYEYIGYEREQARLIGFGLSIATGALIEIGDGTNQFGFSYEDLLMDLAGAGTALLLAETATEDLVGFRFGKVPGPAPRHAEPGIGRDYSFEIYTADLKLAGVAKRLGIDIGPARYLLLSVTYGVKGYPRGAIPDRERQVGFEIGLDLGEMLRAAHVRRDTWWGIGAHIVADNFRIPYTAGGFRYDLNHGRWRGPNTGEGCEACR
jgi:uncharacterized protein YfiM (DUF2279 family)